MRFLPLLALMIAWPVQAAEVRVYTGDPLPVLLAVGQERRIKIDGAQEVRVGVPQQRIEQLSIESLGPHLWLTAHQPFERTRLYLETDIGPLVLAVRTDQSVGLQALLIRQTEASADFTQDALAKPVSYVALTRYAVQTLYTPDHRQAEIRGIRVMPLQDAPVDLFHCGRKYPVACGGAVEVIPHTAWEAPPYYVTALTVRNTLEQALVLDPRDIRGQFSVATIVHPRLEAAGSLRDTTTVVLVSQAPLEQSW